MKRGRKIFYFSFALLLLIIAFSSLTSATIHTCYTCDNCTAEIGNASAGDTILLNNTINSTTSTTGVYCIYFNSNRINLTFEGQKNNISYSGGSSTWGIYAQGTNITLRNFTVNGAPAGYQFAYGIWLNGASNNTVDYVNINYSGVTALRFSGTSGGGNIVRNSTFQETGILDGWDVLADVNSPSVCNNIFVNVTGSGGRAIEYYSSNATIQNKILSELVLCNANNSIINNVTIKSSNNFRNNGIYAVQTNNVSFNNINSSNVHTGIHFNQQAGSNIFINNLTANYNYDYGIFLIPETISL